MHLLSLNQMYFLDFISYPKSCLVKIMTSAMNLFFEFVNLLLLPKLLNFHWIGLLILRLDLAIPYQIHLDLLLICKVTH